jgi:hypothetical protein
MKNFIWLCALLVSMGRLSAQVTVEVLLDEDEFLPGESLPTAVRVTNRSGQTLHFGSDVTWLAFSVESGDGSIVEKKGDVLFQGAFDLESPKRATVRVDIAPYFSLSRQGRYSITAIVKIKEWGREIASQPKWFDVIEGAKLWEADFGVPKSAGASNGPPEVRKYVLEQANYLHSQLKLYFELTDVSGSRVLKVTPIGMMLSFGQPEPAVDRLSNLHVLYQNGPHSFSYTIFSPKGDLTVRQTYDFTTRPRLHADADGNITIVGGTRRLTSSDVPSPTASTNDIAPAKP